jgi:hypothetical protein
MFGEGGKEEVKEFYEQGNCQNCGEPLNNAEGESCFECLVARAESIIQT